MVTRIPTVNITRVEGDQGHLVTCSGCPRVRTIFPNRPAADTFATHHLAGHQTPEPAEEGDWL